MTLKEFNRLCHEQDHDGVSDYSFENSILPLYTCDDRFTKEDVVELHISQDCRVEDILKQLKIIRKAAERLATCQHYCFTESLEKISEAHSKLAALLDDVFSTIHLGK